MVNDKFKLLMLSAMYENGGNTTHRLLDGHPELMVYPYESQPGTKFVNDFLSSMYPLKYRWPTFPIGIEHKELYDMIIDEECKVRAKTPYVSKFRNVEFDFSDIARKKFFVDYLKNKVLSRGLIMEAFFVATFKAWKNFNSSGQESVYVGYSPIIGVDGEKIINDYKGNGYVLHVVRNPFSAYADTKKRAVPISIPNYMLGWVTVQYFSLLYKEKYPKNYFIIRYEDIIKDPKKILGNILSKIGLKTPNTLMYPSWNGEKLEQVYPWGAIRIPTEEMNLKTAKELNNKEIVEIYERTEAYIERFNYMDIYKKVK